MFYFLTYSGVTARRIAEQFGLAVMMSFQEGRQGPERVIHKYEDLESMAMGEA